MSCTSWRDVEDRIRWFLNKANDPDRPGLCARHTWQALGGNYGCPPAWGTADANAVVAKLRAAGKLRTNKLDAPPRGAIVVWQYGKHGHIALSLGDGRIATTDPSNGRRTGIEPIRYPARWGASNAGRPTGWSDYYNGVTFSVGKDTDMPLTEKDIAAIAKRVNRVLGDYTADNEEQPAAGDTPVTGSTRLRAIEKRLDQLEG